MIHGTFEYDPVPGACGTDGRNPGPVLVTQRKVEKQILYSRHPDTGQTLGCTRPDALQRIDVQGIEGGLVGSGRQSCSDLVTGAWFCQNTGLRSQDNP